MERVFGYHWFSQASMAIMVVLLCAGAGSVEASIILTEAPLLDLERLDNGGLDMGRLLVETDAPSGESSSGSSSSSRDPQEQPLDDDNRSEDPDRRADILFAPSQSSSGGMSSGASSVTGGPIATGSFAINGTARVLCTGSELSTRVGDDPSFTLPIPPDNELLRPPQVA